MSDYYQISLDEKRYEVEVLREGEGIKIILDGKSHLVTPLFQQGPFYSFLKDGVEKVEAEVFLDSHPCRITLQHSPYCFEMFDSKQCSTLPSVFGEQKAEHVIRAPMPGKIIELKVGLGNKVQKGQAVVTIEAMKMQQDLFAGMEGVIHKILINSGETVQADQALLILTSD